MYHQKPLIGIKGHIQTRLLEKDATYNQIVELVAEKVTFLSSKKTDKFYMEYCSDDRIFLEFMK